MIISINTEKPFNRSQHLFVIKALQTMGTEGTCLNILVRVKIAQCCLTLCDPMDYTVQGILRARVLE